MSTQIALPAVSIETGPSDWQIIQQDESGHAAIAVSGRWWTLQKRRDPEVRVRLAREGTYRAVSRRHDWVLANTKVDDSTSGEDAGKSGTWELTLDRVPAGGPYRLETCIGSSEDAIEWRRGGQFIHFLGVGDVWLIAGQSNAEGYGRDPVEDHSEIGVHSANADGSWGLTAHGSLHHPWLMFAKILKRERGYPIGLVPTAVGGSEIARWNPEEKADLFNAMSDHVKAAGGALKGCVWYQGESDTGPDDHPQYKRRFNSFVKGLRDLCDDGALPILTVQLNRLLSAENGQGWEAIREQQRQLSHELENVFLFSVFDSVLCDGIHNGTQGNLVIGQRAADVALGGVYGHDIAFLHPECSVARQVDDTIIDLQFENVVTRLDYTGVITNNFPFAVRDDAGDVALVSFEICKRNVFRLRLSRPLQGESSVTGAPGSSAPHVVPRDINGYRGMLAFTLPVSGSIGKE